MKHLAIRTQGVLGSEGVLTTDLDCVSHAEAVHIQAMHPNLPIHAPQSHCSMQGQCGTGSVKSTAKSEGKSAPHSSS